MATSKIELAATHIESGVVDVPAGGLTIYFHTEYNEAPIISVTSSGGLNARIPIITTRSTGSFTVHLLNSSSVETGGYINWIAVPRNHL